MSIYNAAINEGVQALQVVATGRSAEQDQFYNAAYATAANRRAVSGKREALRGSLSLVHQEKILSNQNIRLSQDRAEAAARVQAAVAGSSGGSVDRLIQSTKDNAARAAGAAGNKFDAEFNNILAEINNTTNALSSIQDAAKPSLWGDILGVAGQISQADVTAAIDYETDKDVKAEENKKKAGENKQSTAQPIWGAFS